MTARKRARGPRTTIPKQAAALTERDSEIALGVCQVVNDLVCQVAELPYGDLKRKRPPFFNVMRKFVRDSVQSHQDAETKEVPFCTTKKTKNQDEQESPYGIELVWGIVQAEMEKIEKRERARIYSSQKAARLREKKKQDALEATRAYLDQWGIRTSESESNVDAFHGKIYSIIEIKRPTCKLVPPPRRDPDPLVDPNIFSSPSSRFSDDSDWAVRPHSSRKTRPYKLESSRSLNLSTTRSPPKNHSISNGVRRGRGRGGGRGRGRGGGKGRGGHTPTVRSILDSATGSELVEQATPLHPSVSLTPSDLSKRADAHFDFGKLRDRIKKMPILKDSQPPMRGKKAKGVKGRGRRTIGKGEVFGGGVLIKKTIKLPSLAKWFPKKESEDEKEKEEQRLLIDSIETSGESSQERQIESTIDKALKKVNGMSELDRRGRGIRREKDIEEVKEKKPLVSKTKPAIISRKVDRVKRESPFYGEPSTSRVKRRKEEDNCVKSQSPSMESHRPLE